jgi:hypothetical protein
MQLNLGGDDGTAQGKIKRVHQVVVRVQNTLRALAGPSEARSNDCRGGNLACLWGVHLRDSPETSRSTGPETTTESKRFL